MAVSKVELINKALTLCGARNITNINDEQNNARIVNRVYEISLKSVLAEALWNFAVKRRILSTTADTLEWNFVDEAYMYQLPADVIRIFGTNDRNAIWRIEGEYLISDTSGIGIRYVYFLDNPVKYSSSFVEALIDKLCADISFMILNSKTKAQAFLEKYEGVSLPKAVAENAQVGTQQYLQDDAWELAKFNNQQPSS